MLVYTLEELKKRNLQFEIFYNSADFHMLNQNKVDEVVAFIFGDPKCRACLIGGIRGEEFLLPYSSPYSMFESFKENKLEDMQQYIAEYEAYLRERGIKHIRYKLPPTFYNENLITKYLGSLICSGYSVTGIELNYFMRITNDQDYVSRIRHNARKNLNHSMECGLSLVHCEDEASKRKAYDIIKINRESKNYNLAMSWESVRDTIALTDHDFFLLNKGEESIASAVIFKVTPEIYQVIYWGDIPGFSEERPINYLAYALHQYYQGKTNLLDIGPSMTDGQPNYGLCDFKESIGCDVCSKFILEKDL